MKELFIGILISAGMILSTLAVNAQECANRSHELWLYIQECKKTHCGSTFNTGLKRKGANDCLDKLIRETSDTTNTLARICKKVICEDSCLTQREKLYFAICMSQ